MKAYTLTLIPPRLPPFTSPGQNQFAPNYECEQRSLRISMKLFNKTPADLPPDLKQQVGV